MPDIVAHCGGPSCDMRNLLRVAPIAVLIAVACGPSLQYHRDASVPIPAAATWAWSEPDRDSPAPREAVEAAPDSIQRLIADAIEAELIHRGFPRVRADVADFVVHFHVAQRTVVDTLPWRHDPTTSGGEPPPGGTWGGYGRPEGFGDRVVAWEEGMLVVDVLPRDGRIVAWRGIIVDEVQPDTERDPRRAIGDAVRRLMRKFP